MIKIFAIIFVLLFKNPTQEDETLVTKIYDIQDLLIETKNYDNAPDFDLNAALNGQSNIFRDSYPKQNKKNIDAEVIVNIIKNTIEPEIWYENSSITIFNNNLIVKAPLRIHQQIQ